MQWESCSPERSAWSQRWSLALAEVMRPWLAALVVSIVLQIIGWLLLKAGQRKWANIGDRFERTQDSLQKDATVVARRT